MVPHIAASTFQRPPVENDLSIPELYEYHAQYSPTHPVFAYSDAGAGTTTSISYLEAWKSIQRVAHIISGQTSDASVSPRSDGKPTTIAIMAQSDTLSHIYASIAIMALGYVSFPMSPRNCARTVADLLQETNAQYVLVDSSGPVQELAREVSRLLAEEEVAITLLPMIQSSDWTNTAACDMGCPVKPSAVGDGETVLILHSSGTTNTPRPIRFSKRAVINGIEVPYYGSEVDWSTKRIAGHTNSTFHSMGVATYTWPLLTGATFAVYKPEPIIPTPANFLASLMADRCDLVLCVPVFLKAWAQTPGHIDKLKTLEAVLFSGSGLDKEVGHRLADAGVILHCIWGSTETGPVTSIMSRNAPHPREWEWFKMSSRVRFQMNGQPYLEKVFEPVIIPSRTALPAVLNTTWMGKPAYSFGDLLEQHPSDPSRWRVYGRIDEQITLSTADNINPLAIEAVINQDKRICAAFLFGSQHPHTGIVVVPAPQLSIDGSDQDQFAKFTELIWPAVERANKHAPPFARIGKEMIVVATTSKPVKYTSKGTISRGQVLRLYEPEILSAYHPGSCRLSEVEFPERAF